MDVVVHKHRSDALELTREYLNDDASSLLQYFFGDFDFLLILVKNIQLTRKLKAFLEVIYEIIHFDAILDNFFRIITNF